MSNKPIKFTYYEKPKHGIIPQTQFTYIYNNMVTQPYGFAYFKIIDDKDHDGGCTLEGYFLHNFNLDNQIHMGFKTKEEALQHVRNFGVEWDEQ